MPGFLTRFMIGLCMYATAALAPVAASETNPFKNGWMLDTNLSELRFISLKRGNIPETNRFTKLSGEIDESGRALVRVTLNSVETYIDIRNVRLRFLLFETYRFPMAEITLRIDRGSLNDLAEVKRKIVPMEYTLSMHGREVTRSERLTLFLVDENRVTVSNADPIFVGVNDFDLYEGVKRLENAANVSISPLAIVSFDFTFTRKALNKGPGLPLDQNSSEGFKVPRIAAWNAMDPDHQTCVARLLTLGRLDSVRFEARSARINNNSLMLLDAIADALVRCPSVQMRIDGLVARGEDKNGALAKQRTQAIARTLWARGVQRSRMQLEAGGSITAATQLIGGGKARITVSN